jgi:hypothetical protein
MTVLRPFHCDWVWFTNSKNFLSLQSLNISRRRHAMTWQCNLLRVFQPRLLTAYFNIFPSTPRSYINKFFQRIFLITVFSEIPISYSCAAHDVYGVCHDSVLLKWVYYCVKINTPRSCNLLSNPVHRFSNSCRESCAAGNVVNTIRQIRLNQWFPNSYPRYTILWWIVLVKYNLKINKPKETCH